MIEPKDTAYPRLKPRPSNHELARHFQVTTTELEWVNKNAQADNSRLGLLVLLKTFQRIGYFVKQDQVPTVIQRHLAKILL